VSLVTQSLFTPFCVQRHTPLIRSLTHLMCIFVGMATKTTTDRTAEATNNLSTLVDERLRLKAELDALTERLKALDEVVIEGFQSAGLTKVQTENGKLNLIQSSTTKWNEEVLEELLTTAQWNRVTVRKVDKSRLDAELLLGRIDAIEVEVAKDIKQSKPFLR
jgi:hypothetical protein